MNSGSAVVVRDKIAAKLLEAGVITPEQIEQAKEKQKSDGGSLGLALMHLGAIDEKIYTEFLGKVYNLPVVDLDQIAIASECIDLIPADVATKFQVLPLERRGRILTVAMANPSNIFAIDDIKFITSLDVQPVVCSEVAIKRAKELETRLDAALREYIRGHATDAAAYQRSLFADDTEAGLAFVDLLRERYDVVLMNPPFGESAKDAKKYIETHYPRTRNDLYAAFTESFLHRLKPGGYLAAITSRMKIMAELDIAERRIPQDGRIKLKVGNKKIDLRVSTLPCIFGEKVVMRILDKGNLTLDLANFGMEQVALKHVYDNVAKPYGMVLVTGPTGSGKTTTLYSCLSRVNQVDVNIMTAEDPVEYNLDGINQVQVRDDVGLTFAAALKAFLRQDPNIVMVGEIRDLETGSIAVKAALTGHLVFSTLHTNDAPATINRMIDMGIEPFLVASSTNLIMAQRLVRRICKNCKQPESVPPEALVEIGLPEGTEVFHGKGCEKCNGSGYAGRQGLYEVMPITPALRELILDRASTSEIRKQAQKEGMLTLRQDGLVKVQKGITTIEEVLRETTVQD